MEYKRFCLVENGAALPSPDEPSSDDSRTNNMYSND